MPVVTEGESCLDERIVRGRFGGHADHAAGRRTVQGCRRPPDDLDPFGRADIQVIGSALPVRQRNGYAIGEHLDATHAEARARPEAADGHAKILCEVVAVLHEQAGDTHQ